MYLCGLNQQNHNITKQAKITKKKEQLIVTPSF